jgi:Tol biopolymer transport system component
MWSDPDLRHLVGRTGGTLAPRRIDWPGDVTDAQARPPDGRELLFRGAIGGKVGLFLLDLADGTVTTVVAPRARGNPDRDLVDAEWSPDGSTIAFQAWSDDPPVMQVFTVTLDGSAPKRLTHDDRAWYEGWPHWSPDGRRMAILRLFFDASGQPALDERPVAIAWVDGHDATIESGPVMTGNARLLEWSPDGRWIIERSEDDAQILVDPNGGPPVQLPWTSTSPSSWQRVAPPGG